MLTIRDERPDDADAIGELTCAAFADHPHSSHTEQFIVAALRAAGALTISLVAELCRDNDDDDVGQAPRVVGHIAFSPVAISDGSPAWYGLGPVSVAPVFQRRGIGRELIEAGLARLRALGAAGFVVLGEPEFYARFGFAADPRLTLPGVPPEYFLAMTLRNLRASGEVTYHPAFNAMS